MKRTALLTTALSIFAVTPTMAAERDAAFQPGDDVARESATTNLVLEGYSPVSYFDPGRPQKGHPQFSSTYEGNRYYFTDADQKRKFEQNPEKYAPRFPRHCPYNLAKGREVPVDPTNFKIIDGDLLLFHESPGNNGRKLWNREVKQNEITHREMMDRAENNLLDMNF